jgi:exodeoxyribonuclease VII large subunit
VTHDGQDGIEIRFAFDRRLVDLVKTLPNRRWNAEGKYWRVPDTDVVLLVEMLARERFLFDDATRRLYRARGGVMPLGADPEPSDPGLPGLFDAQVSVSIAASRQNAAEAVSSDYTISRLNREVRAVLESAFPAAIWIVGEISGFNKSAHRRIVGFHLVERDDSGRSLSEVNAVIFEETRRDVERRLAAAGDPFRIEDEVTVRVRARVELYEAWGQYRVRIEDIDLQYTLGEAARRREEIVRRLTEEGLAERNRSLAFPVLPLRIGLITSLGSDAFNDVLRTLQESGFAFEVTAHGARVQGRLTEPSVLNALDYFLGHADEIDVVMICRGGGSRTDLAWFDSEALGRAVAQFPIPVVVGIGHEQDFSVLDFLGWRCKTPTAAAAFLVDKIRSAWEAVEQLSRAALDLAASRVTDETAALADRSRRLARAARAVLDRERAELGHRRRRAARGARTLLRSASGELSRRTHAVPRAAALLLERTRVLLEQAVRQLALGSGRDFAAARERLSAASAAIGPRALRLVLRENERGVSRERRLDLIDPRRVIERGYAILRGKDRHVITDASAAAPGSPVTAELRRGILKLRSEGPDTGLIDR